ncbi:GNAT family N-acetyltransferase [Vagococcus fluvialis]|uniref:GNAT family N-acetyltransferase n=1 Tax=Vagococcus fluvialis TaxID=2738 RepID=UPI001A8E8103|nr:GNAT family N-acetyltransferase [Vagococcus fluvialis]MBO0442052.1 GNAT family N-acetyltransferase [Vagococcus fluvialis]
MHLVFYNEDFLKEIETYQLDDASFTGIPSEVIKENHLKENYHPILCFEKERLVCFFSLDGSASKLDYTSNEKSLLIRSFSTDSRETRKGYATSSLKALIPFIKSNFEGVEEVVLGVNEKNPNAYQMYLKAGFTDTKKRFLGPRGYQNILQING